MTSLSHESDDFPLGDRLRSSRGGTRSAFDPLLEPQRVLDREALPVVVEVDVAVDVERLEPLRPLLELARRIVPARAAAAVEADERPVRGQLARLERPAPVVADHESRAVRPQELVDLGREPALVPELEAVPPTREH